MLSILHSPSLEEIKMFSPDSLPKKIDEDLKIYPVGYQSAKKRIWGHNLIEKVLSCKPVFKYLKMDQY